MTRRMGFRVWVPLEDTDTDDEIGLDKSRPLYN